MSESFHPHFYACIHEAGHVVAARALDFPVAWVSIDPEFMRTNQLAIETDAAAGNPVAMVMAEELIGPILERGFTLDERERSLVDNCCISTLAGPMAEARFNPRYDKAVSCFG